MDTRRRLGVHDGNGDSTKQAKGDKTLIVVREAIILEREGRPFEYSGRIHEVQSMIFQVETTFLFIPGKPHRHSVYTFRICVNLPAFALTTELSGLARTAFCTGPRTHPCAHGAATLIAGPLQRVVRHQLHRQSPLRQPTNRPTNGNEIAIAAR